MKNPNIFLMLILVLLAVPAMPGIVAAAEERDMALVQADQDTSWYINTRTMVRPAPGTVSFWSKMVPSKESRYFEQMGSELEKARKDPDRLEYIQVLQEITCGKNKTKMWDIVFYDRQNRIIYSSTAPKTLGEVLAFQREAGSVRNTVCDTSYRDAPGTQGLVAELRER